MRVCVVGAGAAGICAVKNCLQRGLDVMAFEQSAEIGGTWIYNESNGSDVHSSMYKSLHTNLPKELMSFPDFPFPAHAKSYLPASDVLRYLNLYADTFRVREKIKFRHSVVRIRPTASAWEVIVRNLASDASEILTFDGVLVCNGHFSVPNTPKFEGIELFKGQQVHSHDYRVPEIFKDQKVLVIGGGSSGTDLAQEISKKAQHVFWSHHLRSHVDLKMANITQKPDVKQFTANGVFFQDGSFVEITAVLFCTGYDFTFPFLSVDSQVSCYDNYVQPLYKHCLNINRPTLALIGLLFLNCPFQTFDLQLRFCLRFMTGDRTLPTREEMLADTEKDMSERWARGVSMRKAHSLGEGVQERYYEDLAITADIEPIKPFVTRMYNETRRNKQKDIATFRNYKFTIIDDENFETTLLLP
jgi:dimethylaniline monooxygenase (N-oxide forming)